MALTTCGGVVTYGALMETDFGCTWAKRQHAARKGEIRMDLRR